MLTPPRPPHRAGEAHALPHADGCVPPSDRSVVGAGDLAAPRDALVVRRPTPVVALNMGLERARAAMLTGNAGETLAELDAVWPGAQRTEDGWYLRAGALLALGLPGECDRVVDAALSLRADSSALRWLHALARAVLGDATESRVVLTDLQRDVRGAPLALAQLAIIARDQGDTAAAEALARECRTFARDDPALLDYFERGVAASEGVRENRAGHSDPLTAALEAFGARVRMSTLDDAMALRAHARDLIRHLSAGGTLGGAGTTGTWAMGSTAHGARTVLLALSAALDDDAAAGLHDPIVSTMHGVLHATFARDSQCLSQAMRRLAGLLTASQRAALSAMRLDTPMPAPKRGVIEEDSRPLRVETNVVTDAVRLGLRLLRGNTEPRRSGSHPSFDATGSGMIMAEATPDRALLPTSVRPPSHDAVDAPIAGRATGPATLIAGAIHAGAPWELERTLPSSPRTIEHSSAGFGPRLLALLCVIGAAFCAGKGWTPLAVALGLGAAWLAVRRSG